MLPIGPPALASPVFFQQQPSGPVLIPVSPFLPQMILTQPQVPHPVVYTNVCQVHTINRFPDPRIVSVVVANSPRRSSYGRSAPVRQIVRHHPYENQQRLNNERRDSGLSWKSLSRLPVSKCTEKQIGESCVVCLNEYDENSRCKRLPCMHCFHPKCIDTWLRKKPHCPLCHTNIREAMAKSESKAPTKKR